MNLIGIMASVAGIVVTVQYDLPGFVFVLGILSILAFTVAELVDIYTDKTAMTVRGGSYPRNPYYGGR